MSRIGRKPVTIPEKVKVAVQGTTLKVQGPKGELTLSVHPRITVKVEGTEVKVTRPTDIRTDRALHGLTRSLIQNMVIGVTQGYAKPARSNSIYPKGEVTSNYQPLQLSMAPTTPSLPAATLKTSRSSLPRMKNGLWYHFQ